MGVRGLSSYVTGCQRACSEHVDLTERADGGPDIADQQQHRKKRPVRLAVDGLALVYHVMRDAGTHDLYLELGCDYQSLHAALLDYLSALTAGAGIFVLVIVDGMQDGDKEDTTLERRRSQAADASSAMELLLPSLGGKGEGRGGSATAVAAAASLQHCCSSLLPLFAVETLGAACRDAGVSIWAADREADPELAAACRRHRRAGEQERKGNCQAFEGAGAGVEGRGCDAVLSNDSDFLVMDIPGYIPFWSLGVGADGSAGALVFRRSLVAARLGIPADQMPELACLVGNDWIKPESHVHRLILEAATTGGGNNNGPKKKRKGSCSQKPGAGATKSRRGSSGGSSSNGNGGGGSGGGNGSSHTGSGAHPTASAREFVEATGRYLTDFLRQDGAPRPTSGPSGATGAVSPGGNGVGPDANAAGGRCRGVGDDDVDDGGSRSARRLCARFFPALLDGDELGSGGGVGGGCDESPREQRQQQQGPRLLSASETGCSKASATSAGADSSKQRGKSKKGKGHRGKRHGGETGDSSGIVSDCGGQEQLEGGEGAPADDRGAAAAGDGRAEEGERFLKKFLAARLHYEVPPPRDSDLAEGDEKQSFLAEGRELVATGAGSGLFLSTVGLRAGIWAPPELAQAVLEGVFWCRVVVEDSSAVQEAATTRPTDSGKSPDQSITTPDLPASYSSGFAMFSNVRKGLYELCLAQLVDTPAGSGAAASSAKTGNRFGESFAAASARRGPRARAASLTAAAAGVDTVAASLTAASESPPPPPPPLMASRPEKATTGGSEQSNGDELRQAGRKPSPGGTDGSARAAGTDERRPSRRVSAKEGDEWVVREFRRVGAGVKVVEVVCQVPPSMRLDSSLCILERWGVCLSKLGLGRRDNRLLDALMSLESRPWLGGVGCRTPPGKFAHGEEDEADRGPAGLTALALVAALLLSTATPRTEGNAKRTAAPSREMGTSGNASLQTGGSRRTKTPGSFAVGRRQDAGDLDEGEEGIVAAFVAAATSGCRRPCGSVGSAYATAAAAAAGDGGAGAEEGCCAERSGRGVAGRKVRGGTDGDIRADVASRRASSGRRVPSSSSDGGGCEVWQALRLEAERGEDDDGEKLAGRQRRLREGGRGGGGGGGGKRDFVNHWSYVQSAVWHVNACLAASRLIAPASARRADSKGKTFDGTGSGGGGGGRGGGKGGRREPREYLAPMDPLSLRPALAFEFFQLGGLRRRLRATAPRQREQREQHQQHPRPHAARDRQKHQQQQQRVVDRTAERGSPGNGKMSSRSSPDGVSLRTDQRGCDLDGGCAWVEQFQTVMGAAGLP